MQLKASRADIRDALLIAAFLLCAFGLRIFAIDRQSLWHDEGLSLDLASRGITALLTASSSVDHPPLYFLILHFWIQAVGTSDLAVRALSLFMSLPVIPLLYLFALRLIGRRAAIGAALLAVASPLYLHYAQEARMYALATTLTLAATVLLVTRPVSSRRGQLLRWSIYALLCLGALLSHYTSALIVGVQILYVLASTLAYRRKTDGLRSGVAHAYGWLGAQVIVVAGGGLWLLLANPFSAIYPRTASGASLLEIARSTLVSYSSGHGLEPLGGAPEALNLNLSIATWAAVGVTIIALLGAFSLVRTNLRLAGFLAGCLVLPMVGMYILSAGRHDFTPRYLMVASPFFLLLVGTTLGMVSRRSVLASGFLTLLILGLAAASIVNYETDPRYQRDDFRGLVQYISERSQPGDVAVLNAGYTYPVFTHYVGNSLPWAAIPAGPGVDPAENVSQLETLARKYRRVWLVLWQDYYTDPTSSVKGWLATNGWESDAHSFQGLTLYLYTLDKPVLTSPPTPQHATSIDFEQTIELLGYDLDESALDSQGRLLVTLYWRAEVAPKHSYNVFVHVVNDAYRPVGATDHRPGSDRLPTDTWKPEMLVKDQYELQLSPGTAPAEYRLVVGMYDPTNWDRLRIDGTEHTSVTLQTVKLSNWNARPNPANALQARLGSNVSLIGFDTSGDAKPGSEIEVVLYWRVEKPTDVDYKAFVHLERDGTAELIAQDDQFPFEGHYPTSQWQPGRFLREEFFVKVPPDVRPGDYNLRAGMYDPSTDKRLETDIRAGDILLSRLHVAP